MVPKIIVLLQHNYLTYPINKRKLKLKLLAYRNASNSSTLWPRMMEAARTSETPVEFCQTTRHNNPETWKKKFRTQDMKKAQILIFLHQKLLSNLVSLAVTNHGGSYNIGFLQLNISFRVHILGVMFTLKLVCRRNFDNLKKNNLLNTSSTFYCAMIKITTVNSIKYRTLPLFKIFQGRRFKNKNSYISHRSTQFEESILHPEIQIIIIKQKSTKKFATL